MTDYEKLVALIDQSLKRHIDKSCKLAENIASDLMAGGVIVPPCKVGDTIYDIFEAVSNGDDNIRELKVPEIHINLDRRNKPWIIISSYYFALEDFGKYVFFTREEAEKALAERSNHDRY